MQCSDCRAQAIALVSSACWAVSFFIYFFIRKQYPKDRDRTIMHPREVSSSVLSFEQHCVAYPDLQSVEYSAVYDSDTPME